MIKKVVIFTNFRTASTSFTLLKSEEYDLPYGAELFSHERQSAIGRIPTRHSLQRDYRIHQYELLDLIQSKENLISELYKDNTEICFKVMPTQVATVQDSIRIAEACDKVYFLYSRDFIRTVKSWITVRVHGGFGKTGFLAPARSFSDEKIKQLHLGRHGLDETYKVDMNPNHPALTGELGPVTIHKLRQNIIDNYERMAELYHTIGGELICKEEYFSGDRFNPYNKEVNWTEDPNIEDYDVESLFTIDKHREV